MERVLFEIVKILSSYYDRSRMPLQIQSTNLVKFTPSLVPYLVATS